MEEFADTPRHCVILVFLLSFRSCLRFLPTVIVKAPVFVTVSKGGHGPNPSVLKALLQLVFGGQEGSGVVGGGVASNTGCNTRR